MRKILAGAALAVVMGCGGGRVSSTHIDASDTSADLTKPKFDEAVDYLNNTNAGDADAWLDLHGQLDAAFGQVCGDTFCDGDYANIQSLGFTCSVTLATGQIKNCQWTFTGSYDTVAKSSGNITTHSQLWKCPITITTATPHQLIATLTATSNTDLLHRALPNSTGALYDQILKCLP